MGMPEIDAELCERTINDILFAISVTFFTISTKIANLVNRAKTWQIRAFQEEK